MKIRTLLSSAVLGLVVASGLVGAGAAHAALNPRPCSQISCFPPAPSMTVTGGMGEIAITGAHWSANQWVELDIYAPVSSSLPWVTYYETKTAADGSFSVTYTDPNRCFGDQMEIQAISGNTVITEYAVPGCIRIAVPLTPAVSGSSSPGAQAPQSDSFNFSLRP
jgi:hypothetical protein